MFFPGSGVLLKLEQHEWAHKHSLRAIHQHLQAVYIYPTQLEVQVQSNRRSQAQ